MCCIAQPFEECSSVGLWEKEEQNLPSGFCVKHFLRIKAGYAQSNYTLILK